VKLRFIPREEKFFDLFENAAANIVTGARLLQELVNNFDRAPELARQIEDVEHESDITTHEILDRLNKTFITPFDSEDISALASRLDDVLDYIEATADRMLLYEAGPPTAELIALVDVLVGSAIEVEKAVHLVRDMTQSRRLLDHCIEINRLENDGDRQSRRALAHLFRTAQPIEAIKWREIYEHVEMAIDKCEDVANVLESVVVKNA
jgi:predicted phosphate transport protein (TIGR00153 family)